MKEEFAPISGAHFHSTRGRILALAGSTLLLMALIASACSGIGSLPATSTSAPPANDVGPVAETATAHEPDPTSTLTGRLTPITAPVTPLSDDTATYADPYAGFSFQYPAQWSLIPANEDTKEQATVYSATLSSWDPDQAGTEGIPEEGVKLDVIVIQDQVETLEQAIQWRMSQFEQDVSAESITSQETWELPSGLHAQRATIASDDLIVEEMFTLINGRIVLLSALGETAIFDRIAVTLSALK